LYLHCIYATYLASQDTNVCFSFVLSVESFCIAFWDVGLVKHITPHRQQLCVCVHARSPSSGVFEIAEASGVRQGTKVVLYLKADCKEFSTEDRVKGTGPSTPGHAGPRWKEYSELFKGDILYHQV